MFFKKKASDANHPGSDAPKHGLGIRALRLITKIWQVDDSRIIWSENGFEWWPGDFRVRGRASKHAVQDGEERWELSVRTDFLKDVPVRSKDFARGARFALREHQEARTCTAAWFSATESERETEVPI